MIYTPQGCRYIHLKGVDTRGALGDLVPPDFEILLIYNMHPWVMSIQYRNVKLTSPRKCSQMASLRTKLSKISPHMLGGYHYAAQAVPLAHPCLRPCTLAPPNSKLVPTPLHCQGKHCMHLNSIQAMVGYRSFGRCSDGRTHRQKP